MSTPLPPVRSVQRALQLLRALNEHEFCSLQELQLRTGLPKTTIHRLLATLQVEGYVHSGEEAYGEYRLTPLAGNLSSGVTQKQNLAATARPILIAATKRSKWPLAVGVVDGAAVRVNVCTMPYSPYSTRPTTMGRRYDLFTSALGKCYLAFCSSKERRILLDLDEAEHGKRRWGREMLKEVIRPVLDEGYALRRGSKTDASTAIAVPLFDNDREIVGVLACSTFSRTSVPQWIERNLASVQEVAREIEQKVGRAD